MFDMEQADRFYDLAMQLSVEPPWDASFDRRVLTALSAVAGTLSRDATITEALVRDYAAKGWVTIHFGADDDPNLSGLPMYVIPRLQIYRELAARGFSDAEVAAHCSFEDMFIDEFLTEGTLAYEDDDRALLIADLTEAREDAMSALAQFDAQSLLIKCSGAEFRATYVPPPFKRRLFGP